MVIVLLLFLVISGVFTLFSEPFQKENNLSLTQLVSEINQEKIKKITITGNKLLILYKDESKAQSRKETESALSESLINYGADKEKLKLVEVETKETGETWTWLAPLLFSILPLLLFGVFFWFIFKQAKGGAMQAFDFTKARARLFGAEGHPKEKITFKDVAGLKEAKQELMEVVDFLKNPKKFLEMGATIPRGVLLMGSPGTGKTLLARATAGEANVPFFHISGSEFVEMFVGVGASITGDTPVLIKEKDATELLPIGKFIDQFYTEDEEGLKNLEGIETLGANFSKGKKFFKSSGWKKVKSAYRHKVNEIYEIQYLGGKIKATGDHSIFIREKNRVIEKKAQELKEGDILVNLPYKVRSIFIPGIGTTHAIKSHQFGEQTKRELPVWNDYFQLEKTQSDYEFALANRGELFQREIAGKIGVSQSTIGLWQRGINQPRYFTIASCQTAKGIPHAIKITPSLAKLLGYYTAEGRKTEYYLQFVFGAHEKVLHQDCISLMKEIFGVDPHLAYTEENSLRITYHAKFLGDFFERHCGNGSHKKHIPEFLWDMKKEYFLAYLDGYSKGDGYTSKEGKLMVTSVSLQLIRELAWLASMHGIQTGIRKTKTKGGRIIKNRPLPESTYWILIIGKTSHPFSKEIVKYPYQIKKPKIQKIIKKPYNDYVYDLCGCENEAFFGGEKPILLHNSRVRDLFSTAKKAAPAIIFIDELDAIGRHRGTGFGGGHDEREQTLNQILVEMDGFERDTKLIICAATNRPDVLDPALLRPGRFDRRVVLDLPDINDREEILKIHCQGKPLDQNIKLREVAERTPGFSGADLANVANEAAILAARRNKHQVFQEELLESIEKVLLGPERKSHILSEKEKEIAAYHEAGHALVSASLPETEPIRKISIVARGMAAGYTLKMPTEDKKIKSKTEFLAEIATLLGGYCAEKLKFNEITTGASNDLERASTLARKLVKEYGMSSLGPVSFGEKEELVFLGKELGEARNYSEKVASQIDKEVEKFIREGENRAAKILTKKKNLLEKIAKTLIEKETIEREEFEKLMGIAKTKKKSLSTLKTTKT
ncbi:MAG: AAA family ATPase [bacterium]|nr:AAA family ATPase [bacterium]